MATVSVYYPPEKAHVKRTLEAVAEAEGITFAELVRKALDHYIFCSARNQCPNCQTVV